MKTAKSKPLSEELIGLLGQPVVLLKWPKGVKGLPRKWGHLSAADMTPEYFANLERGNVGVALGPPSGGLCVVDIDVEGAVDSFIELNIEWAQTCLRTRGARGCSFWIRFVGEYLQTSKKLPFGEFRSGGNQSIIWGIHPVTKEPYSKLVDAPPATITWDQLKWPGGFSLPMQQSCGDVELEMLESKGVGDVVSVCVCPRLSLSDKPLVDVVSDAAKAFPAKRHQNNAILFNMARRLKFIDGITSSLKLQAFELWYKSGFDAGQLNPKESRDDYEGKFWSADADALSPDDIFERAWAAAKSGQMPPEAAIMESDGAKMFVALCYHLHRLHENGDPWFIPAEKAAKLFGVEISTIGRWFAKLEGRGVVKTHTPYIANRRATRRLWIAPG